MATKWHDKLQADAYDFAPDILRLQHRRRRLAARGVVEPAGAVVCLLLWTIFGKLDIIAVAQGKLVPQSSLKIVQPAEAGIVKEILVSEGDECMPDRFWHAWMPSSPMRTGAPWVTSSASRACNCGASMPSLRGPAQTATG